jgi:hypothetical protein
MAIHAEAGHCCGVESNGKLVMTNELQAEMRAITGGYGRAATTTPAAEGLTQSNVVRPLRIGKVTASQQL